MNIIPGIKGLERKYGTAVVVIGVHSAKFSSEKESDNIREAIQRYDLEHPVVNDRDFAIWNTYGIQSWPTVVLIDPTGHVVGGQAGEGGFDVFDRAIGDLTQKFSAQLDRKLIKLVLEKERRAKAALSYPRQINAAGTGRRPFFRES